MNDFFQFSPRFLLSSTAAENPRGECCPINAAVLVEDVPTEVLHQPLLNGRFTQCLMAEGIPLDHFDVAVSGKPLCDCRFS